MKINVKLIEKDPKKYADECSEKKAVRVLHHLDSAFFGADPLISDAIYDALRNALNKKYPSLKSKIGQKLSDDDVRLPIPMSSLNQYRLGSKSLARALALKHPIILSDKLDGQSIELVYRDHMPVAAYTRGDAVMGKDISHHIPFMRIPPFIEVPNLTIRVEAIFKLELFNKHLKLPEGMDFKTAKKQGRHYKAARNAASGVTRNFSPLPVPFTYLDFVAFQIVAGNGSDKKQSTQLKMLDKMGFTVVEHRALSGNLTEKVLEKHLERRTAKSKYEIDGIVVTYDIVPDVPTAANPSHAFKFKMNSDADSVLVTVTDVAWQVSKYGYLTPVIQFDPTPMSGGVMVSRATGHNAFFVLNGYLKDSPVMPDVIGPIGVGAVLKIVRSGKVIPYIQEIIKPAKKPALPTDFAIDEYELDGVEFRLLVKTSEMDIRRLTGFMSAMSFMQQGPSTAALLFEAGYKTIPDLFLRLTEKKAIAVLKQAKGKALISSIKKAKEKTDLVRWLSSVAPYYIEGAHSTTFHKLAESIDILSIESSYDLLTQIDAYKEEQAVQHFASLVSIGFGEKFLRKKSVKKLLDKVRGTKGIDTKAEDLTMAIIAALELADQCGVTLEVSKVEVTSDKLHGLVAAFSGVRDAQLKEDILKIGGAASDSMTNATTVLIVKDPGSGSSKIEKAQQRGIPILTPAEFRQKYLE